MRRVSPPKIPLGSHIGIAAPASFLSKKLLRSGMEQLASWGYSVECDERVLLRERFHAGPDATRAEIFDRLVREREIEAIWCARGGYGVTRMLPFLDRLGTLAALKRNPKLIVGYSDITALHMWAWAGMGLKGLHAPLAATPKWLKLKASTRRTLQDLLGGSANLNYTQAWPTRWLGRGRPVEGVVVGGNLCMLTNLAGTRWQPDLRGSLLFLEDCAESSYRIDRMITFLRNTGMLRGVRAVLAGDFKADAPKDPPSQDWKKILEVNFVNEGIPVLYNLPVGHGVRNEPLPIGVRARVTRGGKLELLEQLVR